MERTGEFDFKDILQERMYERTGVQIDVLFPHVLVEKVEVASLVPQERSPQRTVEIPGAESLSDQGGSAGTSVNTHLGADCRFTQFRRS